MSVDYANAQHSAAQLRRLLVYYASKDLEAAMCFRELSPLIDAILEGTAPLPVSDVRCGWHFHEGGLRKYEELEAAYSDFAFLVKGRDAEKLTRLFNRSDSDPKYAARLLSPELAWWENIWSCWSRLMDRLKRH